MSEQPIIKENLMSVIEWLIYLNAIDEVDRAKISIGLEHHEIHDGNSYT